MGASRRVQGVKTGTLHMFAMVAGEPGYLRCDGSAYNVADKPRLFAEIGYTYGGAGAVFNVPEMRGESVRGLDEGRGVDVGRVLGVAQAGQMPSHAHDGVPPIVADIDRGNTGPSNWSIDSLSGITGYTGGTDNASENRMRNMAFPFAIKD